jgi:arginase family enzyme
MNLNDYFEPVSLDKPEPYVGIGESVFGRNLHINTPSTPIDEISNYQLAILGIPEDRNSFNSGSSGAPDLIRRKLYELFKVQDKLRIIDLGNLKQSPSPEDTYYGLRDVMTDLLNNQVTAIVLGGTQDITKGVFMAYELRATKVNVVTVDARIDMEEGPLHAASWNIPIINSPRLFRYTSLGHQQYLVNPAYVESLEKKGFDVVRLGTLRNNPVMAEPFMRDAHLVSFDIAAVKQSEAPGTRFPSPNGLLAEEACQLSRFAGLSDLVSCFGIFEINGKYDHNDQTSHLAAQAIWYFIEGFTQRKKETPAQNHTDFKVFMVNHQDMEHALTFYKSQVTGRWWMEIPEMKSGGQVLVACSQEEYQQACNHDIPEMWWKAFQRIN